MAAPPLGQNHKAPPGGVLGPTAFFNLEVTSTSDGSLWIDVQQTHKIAKLFLIKARRMPASPWLRRVSSRPAGHRVHCESLTQSCVLLPTVSGLPHPQSPRQKGKHCIRAPELGRREKADCLSPPPYALHPLPLAPLGTATAAALSVMGQVTVRERSAERSHLSSGGLRSLCNRALDIYLGMVVSDVFSSSSQPPGITPVRGVLWK